MDFRRPEGSVFPQIYETFAVNGQEFYISDLEVDHDGQAAELIEKFVIPEENFCKAIQIHTKPNAMKVMMDGYQDLFNKRTSLVCVRKLTGEVVGLNILAVKTVGQKRENVIEDPDMRILMESSDFTTNLFDVFGQFKVNHYLHAYGLGVKSEHRGKGIAVELLKARAPLLKSLGLTVTSTTFSTASSQKSAVKAGYKETFAISYEDVQLRFPSFDFSQASGTHCKNFVLQVE